MKQLIEPFTSLAGWTSDGTITAEVLNAHPSLIADRHATSVIFHIPSGNEGKVFSKVINLSVAGYSEMVLSCWSREKAGDDFRKPAQHHYEISFDNGAHSYYLPTWRGFNDVTLAIRNWATVTTLRIKVLHNDEDYLCLSALNAVVDEYPLDILQAVMDDLARQAYISYGDGLAIGDTVTATAGERNATLTGNHDFMARYAMVRFGGANPETHFIDNWDETTGVVTFGAAADGEIVQYNHADDEVRLVMAVQMGQGETDLAAPSIVVTRMVPEPVLRTGSGIVRVEDSLVVGGGVDDRAEESFLVYPILIDCEARHDELLARLNRIAREFLYQGNVWINARKHDFSWSTPPVEVEPDRVNETLPKAQYVIEIEVRESIGARVVLPLASGYNLAVVPQQGGVL